HHVLNTAASHRSLKLSSLHHRPPTPPPLPYTTLFRSLEPPARPGHAAPPPGHRPAPTEVLNDACFAPGRHAARSVPAGGRAEERSEEHTSELQSLRHLVCRLLLEKKKITRTSRSRHSA